MAISIDMILDRDHLIDFLKENENTHELDLSTRTAGYKYDFVLCTLSPRHTKDSKDVKGIIGLVFGKEMKTKSYLIQKIIIKYENGTFNLYIDNEKFTETNDINNITLSQFG